MLRKCIIFFLFRIVANVELKTTKDCLGEARGICRGLASVQDILFNPELGLPDKDFLGKNCEGNTKIHDCFFKNSEKCDKEEKEGYSRILSLIKEICSPEHDLGKLYRQHVDCANKYVGNIKLCKEKTEPALDSLLHLYEWPTQFYIEHYCSRPLFMVLCFLKSVGENCGTEAEELGQKMYKKMALYLNKTCTDAIMLSIKKNHIEFLEDDFKEVGFYL